MVFIRRRYEVFFSLPTSSELFRVFFARERTSRPFYYVFHITLGYSKCQSLILSYSVPAFLALVSWAPRYTSYALLLHEPASSLRRYMQALSFQRGLLLRFLSFNFLFLLFFFFGTFAFVWDELLFFHQLFLVPYTRRYGNYNLLSLTLELCLWSIHLF